MVWRGCAISRSPDLNTTLHSYGLILSLFLELYELIKKYTYKGVLGTGTGLEGIFL